MAFSAPLALGISILIGVAGQLLFKLGSQPNGALEQSHGIFGFFLQPVLIAGLAAYGLSAILYIWCLRSIPLTLAYPSLAFGYVLVFLSGTLFLGESFNAQKLVATLLIVCGVALLWK